MMHLRYNVAQSLDGFIAPPDESTSWIVPDESIDFDALHASFDYYVMGRRTWDIMRALEPNPCLNKPPGSIIVISRILRQEEHPHIAILREGYIEYIRRLKAKGGKGIWLMGGGWLAAECLEAKLLDGLDVAVMPVLLRDGFKVVDSGLSGWYNLKLQSLEKLDGSGILMAKYRVEYDHEQIASS
jgi:dihydrofolate reductase